MPTPEELLRQAFEQGKITGSWLITGPAGVGKKTLVRRLINFLLKGDLTVPFQGVHAHVKWIERSLTDEAKKEIQKAILAGQAVETSDNAPRKKEITVDDIRAALQFLSLKPERGAYQILVIAPADEMNMNAANALLKMLEEPGENNIILLVSDNPGRLLPTIRSRCRMITLRPKPIEEVEEILKKIRPDAAHADLAAELSAGSVGMGMRILDNNGLDLFQKIQALDVPADDCDISVLEALANEATQDDDTYGLFKTLYLNAVTTRARQEALAGRAVAETYVDMYEMGKQLFRETDALNLDRKQAVKTLILKAARMKG